MIKGIGGKPYIDLDPYIDVKGFIDLHPKICKGFALAREYAKEGTWMTPQMKIEDMSYIPNWKPIFKAFAEYQALPDDDPIKVEGQKIFPQDFKDYKQRNIFTRFLKNTLGASDPYIYYFLWDEGNNFNERNSQRTKTEESKYFPEVVEWIESLLEKNIISQVGRVVFFVCDHNGKAFEHRDLTQGDLKDDRGYSDHKYEFIHIRPRTKRGFYVWDPESKSKVYINSHSAFWNDQDWHGGEHSDEVEYSIRIDCAFTDEFRKKLGISHLEFY